MGQILKEGKEIEVCGTFLNGEFVNFELRKVKSNPCYIVYINDVEVERTSLSRDLILQKYAIE